MRRTTIARALDVVATLLMVSAIAVVTISVRAMGRLENELTIGRLFVDASTGTALDGDRWYGNHYHEKLRGFEGVIEGTKLWTSGDRGLARFDLERHTVQLGWEVPRGLVAINGSQGQVTVTPSGLGVVYEAYGHASGATAARAGRHPLAAGIAGAEGWEREPVELPVPAGSRARDLQWRDRALEVVVEQPDAAVVTVRVPIAGELELRDGALAPQAATAPPERPREDLWNPYPGTWEVVGTSLVPRARAAHDAPAPARYDSQFIDGSWVATEIRGDLLSIRRDSTFGAFAPIARIGWPCRFNERPGYLQLVRRPAGGFWLVDVNTACYVTLDAELHRVDPLTFTERLARRHIPRWRMWFAFAGLPALLAIGLALAWRVRRAGWVVGGLVFGAGSYLVSSYWIVRPMLAAL